MSIFKAFTSLPPSTRLIFGGAFLAWGAIGLYVSDSAEQKLGFAASEEDKERLQEMLPRVVVVEKEEKD